MRKAIGQKSKENGSPRPRIATIHGKYKLVLVEQEISRNMVNSGGKAAI